jgi:hypothetical protein
MEEWYNLYLLLQKIEREAKGGLVTFICGLQSSSSQVHLMKTTCLTVPLDMTAEEHIKL